MEPGPVSTARPTNSCERMRTSRVTSHKKSRAAVRSEHLKQELAPLSHQPATPSIVTACGDPPPADHTPSGRGVCLIFSPCPGPLTTMTGSDLAGHRLLEVLVASCFAPRSSHGGMAQGHPSNDPHRPALRASSHPLRGRAVQGDMPGRRDTGLSLRPMYGKLWHSPATVQL